MIGSECLVKALEAQEIRLVFTNPGTSEVGFIAEIAKTNKTRAVPVLFEGIAAGAADGFYRMTGRPAATLLHVGPGLANAWSALHNAAKAGSGVVNIVGQLSQAHLAHESPLQSDLVALASSVSSLVRYPTSAGQVGGDVHAVSDAAQQGKVTTLVIANDVGWSEGAEFVAPPATVDVPGTLTLDPAAMTALAEGTKTLLLLGGGALRTEALQDAAAIAAATGCHVMLEWANARCDRGVGVPAFARIPYQLDDAIRILAAYDAIVLCGAAEPIAFFNYRDTPSRLSAAQARLLSLQANRGDPAAALRDERVELASKAYRSLCRAPKASETGTDPTPVKRDSISDLIAAKMPEGAIVVNESITSAGGLFAASATAARHTWLENRGGSIGFALPVSIGAAIASPASRVVALCGDGSTMYSVQALWTIAREKLDVTVVIFANKAYGILIAEMERATGKPADCRSNALLQLDDPAIDWVSMARSLGVESMHANSLEDFETALSTAFGVPGPNLIEVATELLDN